MTRGEKITGEVALWANVTIAAHRFGGTEFLYNNKRELGHLHGNSLLDIPFPMNIRNELVSSGRVQPHHILPESGWVSFYIRNEHDADEAILLLRMSYDVAAEHYRNKRQ